MCSAYHATIYRRGIINLCIVTQMLRILSNIELMRLSQYSKPHTVTGVRYSLTGLIYNEISKLLATQSLDGISKILSTNKRLLYYRISCNLMISFASFSEQL